MFGSCGTTLGGALGASGRIRVCRGCVTRTGIERMLCREGEASELGLGVALGAAFAVFSGGAAGLGRAAGSEIRGRSGCAAYQVNSICTGASVGALWGRNPQIGRTRSQITPTCQRDDAANALAGTLPRIQST